LAGRKVFVYAGNMGVAQGMGVPLDLAQQLHARDDIGFVFVGRGRDAQWLRAQAQERGLDNVAFYDEIEPHEIPGLYAQCAVGMVILDPRHKTHNVPGKFLSYMQCGLPVLAAINPGNDLERLINEERVGRASSNASIQDLSQWAQELVAEIAADSDLHARCKALGAKLFSPGTAVCQVIAALAV
jgi:glycosyltransferase involved in cell wall biosynthesis